jgi:hypothetical protein
MAALRTGSVVKLHHLGGCSYPLRDCKPRPPRSKYGQQAKRHVSIANVLLGLPLPSIHSAWRSSFSEQRKMTPGQWCLRRRGIAATAGVLRQPASPRECGAELSDRSLSRRCPWRRVMVPAAGRRASPVQARSKAICGRCLPDHRAQARSAGRLACARSES